MAAPTGTFQTYTAIGRREDLIDLISNISPTDTPVLSKTESARAYNTYHEWQTDSLETPTANAHIEGDTPTASTISPTTRTGNYTQIVKFTRVISDTQKFVKNAGRNDEVEYQKMKALKDLSNAIEYAFVVNSAAASGASGTARQLKGLAGWVTTNQSTASANRSLTSTILDTLLNTVWLAGGKPDVILAGGTQKIAFRNTTNFPGTTYNVMSDAKKLINSIEVYESSFGVMEIVLSTIMGNNLANQIFCLEMGKFRKAWLRPPKIDMLGKREDGETFSAIAEVTLESLNEKASGVVKNLS